MQAPRQINLTSIRRDAWVEVDLTSVEHNLKTLRDGLAKIVTGYKDDHRAQQLRAGSNSWP